MLIFKLEYALRHADVLTYQILENTLPNSLETRDTRAQKEMDRALYRRFKRKSLSSQRKDSHP